MLSLAPYVVGGIVVVTVVILTFLFISEQSEDSILLQEYNKFNTSVSITSEKRKESFNINGIQSGRIADSQEVIHFREEIIAGTATQQQALKAYEEDGEFPFYIQYASTWKEGNDMPIGKAGCGPTSFAMVATYLTETLITPIDTATYFKSQGMWGASSSPRGVTNNEVFSRAADKWGLTYSVISGSKPADADTESKVKEALKSGSLIVISTCGKKGSGATPATLGNATGKFTSGGHYIVLRGITPEGKILVADPNDNTKSKNYNTQEFDYMTIVNEMKHNFQVFSK